MASIQYILKRLALMVPTFFLVMVIIFLLVRFLPGDPATAIAGDRASDADLAAIRDRLGLNEPMWVQFWLFLTNTLQGDLGRSILMRTEVVDVIFDRLPTTAFLTLYAVGLSIAIAGPLAFVAALNRGRWPDNLIRTVFQVGLSMPVFYIGLVLLTFLGAQLRWFPVGGYGEGFWSHMYHLFLPSVTVALYTSAIIMRNLRSAIIEVLDAEYVQFARAKGLPDRLILGRHVLRNALISTVTLLGLSIGNLMSGTLVTETVFAVPGLGRLMLEAIFARDYPLIQGLTLTFAVLVSLVFLLGCAIIGISTLLALFLQVFAPYDPNFIDYLAVRQPPSWAHPFGTDSLGRDAFSRVIHAYSVNMQMAVLATVFALVIGVVVGALVGYYRGIADMIFGRVVDAVITFPFLVLVIAVVAVLGPGLINMYIAITMVGWVYYARLMRAEVIAQMGNDYAAAGLVMGYSDRRIIFRHLLPNAITPVVIYWMTDMALAILLGSSLGYLGLGAQPPQAEWGVLIAEGRNFITTAWWLSLMPGIAIVLTGLGFSLIGDGLADLLRPRG